MRKLLLAVALASCSAASFAIDLTGVGYQFIYDDTSYAAATLGVYPGFESQNNVYTTPDSSYWASSETYSTSPYFKFLSSANPNDPTIVNHLQFTIKTDPGYSIQEISLNIAGNDAYNSADTMAGITPMDSSTGSIATSGTWDSDALDPRMQLYNTTFASSNWLVQDTGLTNSYDEYYRADAPLVCPIVNNLTGCSYHLSGLNTYTFDLDYTIISIAGNDLSQSALGQMGALQFMVEKDVIPGQVTAPVPEPETYTLMGLGLVGLIASRKRFTK